MGRILSTKQLSEPQRQLILNTQHSLVEYNAISIQKDLSAIPDSSLSHVIITSQNTAKICIDQQLSMQKVFCVGKKTAHLLLEAGYQVVLICPYGQNLAQVLTTAYREETFTMLCSAQRLGTIPNALTSAGISFTEYHVYSTLHQYKDFSEPFDVVMFFSPSGVKSFYHSSTNKAKAAVCIGQTTAKTAQNYCSQVAVANSTQVESCIAKAIKLLNT